MEELIKQLREGPTTEGETPDGIELFDLDSARETMCEAADEIGRLHAALSMTREGVDADEAMRIHNCLK